MKKSVQILAATVFLSVAAPVPGQQKLPKTAKPDSPGLSLRPTTSSANAQLLLDPLAAEWTKLPAQRIALNRTPRLYDTESPSEPEISFLDVRLVRIESKLLIQMTWHDPTKDVADIAKPSNVPMEGRAKREQTEATDRFFDSAAVMHPLRTPEAGAWPSLQMGDAGDPVSIYFWNAARGSARMQAEGRGTTRRTGETFPAQAVYRDVSWHVTMELDGVPPGMPVAFAVWNGNQQDRDGRKYFSTWLKLE